LGLGCGASVAPSFVQPHPSAMLSHSGGVYPDGVSNLVRKSPWLTRHGTASAEASVLSRPRLQCAAECRRLQIRELESAAAAKEAEAARKRNALVRSDQGPAEECEGFFVQGMALKQVAERVHSLGPLSAESAGACHEPPPWVTHPDLFSGVGELLALCDEGSRRRRQGGGGGGGEKLSALQLARLRLSFGTLLHGAVSRSPPSPIVQSRS
jgi:hypothetical protein